VSDELLHHVTGLDYRRTDDGPDWRFGALGVRVVRSHRTLSFLGMFGSARLSLPR
jgi:hypothetical protein